jgi:beta-phosphoglucomutase
MIATVILDFDGVVIESLPIKNEAFRELFSFAPDHLEEIVDFHVRNGGMSRFDKFRHIYAHILKEELTEEQSRKLGDRFFALSFEGVVNSPLVGGAREFLESCHEHIPLYIVSATPEPEIHEIIRRKNLGRYFVRVYGSPRTKAECIREILDFIHSSPQEAVFVGDAPNDWEAAQATGVRFIARIKPGDPNRFIALPGVEHVVSDLFELREVIAEER